MISDSDLEMLLTAVSGACQDERLGMDDLRKLSIQHLETVRRKKIELFFERRFQLVSVCSVNDFIDSLKAYEFEDKVEVVSTKSGEVSGQEDNIEDSEGSSSEGVIGKSSSGGVSSSNVAVGASSKGKSGRPRAAAL